MSQLRSTGRAPSVNLNTLREMLTRYFDEDQPSVASLAEEFEVCEASVRKYLRMALGPLPRGKAAAMPRERQNVQALVNGVSTADLLGEGRLELFRRHVERGDGVVALSQTFGISRRRAKALKASMV